MSTLTLSYHRYTERPSLASSAQHLPALLQTWYERARQRRQLAELSACQLSDIGIDRAAALAEAAKPFWMP